MIFILIFVVGVVVVLIKNVYVCLFNEKFNFDNQISSFILSVNK